MCVCISFSIVPLHIHTHLPHLILDDDVPLLVLLITPLTTPCHSLSSSSFSFFICIFPPYTHFPLPIIFIITTTTTPHRWQSSLVTTTYHWCHSHHGSLFSPLNFPSPNSLSLSLSFLFFFSFFNHLDFLIHGCFFIFSHTTTLYFIVILFAFHSKVSKIGEFPCFDCNSACIWIWILFVNFELRPFAFWLFVWILDLGMLHLGYMF